VPPVFLPPFFSIRSFYEIQNRPLPLWIKPTLIAVIVVTFIVNNIITILEVSNSDLHLSFVILFWMFGLGLIYDVVFNYGFHNLHSIVTQYRSGPQGANDVVSKGLQNMKRYQIISTIAVTIAALICLGVGFVEVKSTTTISPDSYNPNRAILMLVQVILWFSFLWFSWVPIHVCGLTIGHESVHGSRAPSKQKSTTSIPRSPSEADVNKRPALNLSTTSASGQGSTTV